MLACMYFTVSMGCFHSLQVVGHLAWYRAVSVESIPDLVGWNSCQTDIERKSGLQLSTRIPLPLCLQDGMRDVVELTL